MPSIAHGQEQCKPRANLVLLTLARPHLRELAAYTPIEPFEVLSQRLGRRPEDIIKLDANENPYGPPPEVREALAAMPFPNIYPDPETRRLRGALAAQHGLPVEHLLVGVLLLLSYRKCLNVLLLACPRSAAWCFASLSVCASTRELV